MRQSRDTATAAFASAAAAGTVAACFGVWLFWRWLADMPDPPPPRGPTERGSLAEARAAAATRTVDLQGTFVPGTGARQGPDSGTWPSFRGPRRDNRAESPVPLADAWPAEGPPLLWSRELGEGHAGPAVWNGRVYVLDYDEEAGGDSLRCLSLADGLELWHRWYRKPTKRNHGISRTVPAIAEGRVVTLGPQCQVLCVDAESGAFVWGRDLPSADGTTVPLWYAGQCPLIDLAGSPTVVLAPCGPTASLIGLDLQTGDVLWSAPNPPGWQMSHGSIATLEVEGVRMYVYAALGGVLAVKADGPDCGALLASSDAWKPSVQAPTPLPLPDGQVLLTAGYGAGAALFRIAKNGTSSTGWVIETVRTFDRREFGSEQQTPILHEGVVFGVMPADGGAARRELVAMRTDGARLWASGGEDRFGLGPYVLVDGQRMLVLADDGVLTMARVTPDGYRRLARAKLLHGRDAWGPMALVGGRLLLRDDRTLVCVDLRRDRTAP